MKLIAHRGYKSDFIKENTFMSIKNAFMDHRIKGVEFDIRMTSDNKIVIIHDTFINRTSNGNGMVKNKTLEELKKYNFGSESYFQTIPTLEGILSLIDTNKMFLIELKENSNIFVMELLNIINRHIDKNIYLMSFNHDLLNQIRYDKKILITLFLDNRNVSKYCLIAPFYKLISKKDIKSMLKNNKTLFLWTLSSKDLKKYKNKCYLIFNN